jgi:hypothetical protein
MAAIWPSTERVVPSPTKKKPTWQMVRLYQDKDGLSGIALEFHKKFV